MQIVFDGYSGRLYCFTHCCQDREMETDTMGCVYRSNGSYIIKLLCDGTVQDTRPLGYRNVVGF